MDILSVLYIVFLVFFTLFAYAIGRMKSQQNLQTKHIQEMHEFSSRRRILYVCRNAQQATHLRKQLGGIWFFTPVEPQEDALVGSTASIIVFAEGLIVTERLEAMARSRVDRYGREGKVIFL